MPTPDTTEARRAGAGLGVRLLWFAGLWAASVATFGAVVLAIRWAIAS